MSDDAAFLRSRGFGGRVGFGERPAVLVVDLIHAFTDPALPLGMRCDAAIGQANRVIDAARAARAPVTFSTAAYEHERVEDAGHWRTKQPGPCTLRAGTNDVDVDARLHRLPGDALLSKKYASCFFGTDLVSRLNARRVDTLIVCGCATSGGVRASTVDALQLGYRPVVVRQAVVDRSEAAHAQSLLDIDAHYGDVVDADDVVRYLEGFRRA